MNGKERILAAFRGEPIDVVPFSPIHFVFASSCNTSPLTPWRNLLAFRDAAREYGRMDKGL